MAAIIKPELSNYRRREVHTIGADLSGTTKAALMQMTRSLAFEWAKYGIRVNSISPGPWATGMLEPLVGDGKTKETLARLTPSRRLAKGGDFGGTVFFLVSDSARHITGQDLVVDGGVRFARLYDPLRSGIPSP